MSAPTSPTLNHNEATASSSSVVPSDLHAWHPQQAGEVRSPCPALNTLANHSYLPHDGKQLTATVIMKALEEGYHLSSPLAHVLVYGGIALLGQFGAFGLNDLARHNRIEHDASLVHDDTPARDEYAPLAPDATLIKQFLEQVGEDHILSIEDLARHRVWRESQCPALNSLHSEIAKGEMAIAFGLFTPPGSEKQGIPVDLLRTWFTEERLPDGWKPSHTQGLLQTMHTSRMIKEAMEKIEHSGEDVAPPSVRLEREHQVEHEQKV